MQKLITLVAVLASSSAFAQRISVMPFSGAQGPAVNSQLTSSLCDSAECVAPGTVSTKNKPDAKKVAKAKLIAVVVGSVAGKGKASKLTLEVQTKGGKKKDKKVFPLDASGLNEKNLQAATEFVQKLAGITPPKKTAPEPEPAPEPKKEPTPAKSEPAKTEPAPAKSEPAKTEAPKDDVRDDGPDAATTPEPVKADKNKPKFLVIDVGADLLSRKFEYANAVTANLRRYDLPFFPAIAAKVEFYPLAIKRTDALAGLGVDLGLGTAPYLKSRKASETDPYPTSMLRFDAGLRYRIIPSKSLGLAITPFAGVRIHSFTVGANPMGVRLDGLPDISETGLRLGAQIDFTVLDDRLSLYGRFAVTPTFSQGEIISSAYFSGGGSSLGIDAAAGIGVRLVGPLWVRGGFDFTQYNLTFKTTDTDTYQATGATDQYIGGNVSLRLMF